MPYDWVKPNFRPLGAAMYGKNMRVFIILSLRRTGDDHRVILHKGFKIRPAGIVPVSLEFTAINKPLPSLLKELCLTLRGYEAKSFELSLL